MAYRIEYAGSCIQGLVRKRNEDNLWCIDHCLPIMHTDEDGDLSGTFKAGREKNFAVFDGIGGEKNGEVASYLAAKVYEISKETAPEQLLPEMNRSICEYADSNQLKRIGVVVAAACFGKTGVYGYNLGDSRFYRLTDGELVQLSTDHTVRSALNSERTLTGCLGTDSDVRDAFSEFQADYKSGDCFVLCTDGLTKLVSDRRIASILKEKKTLKERLMRLVRLVLRKGAEDNTTIFLFEVTAPRTLLAGLF